MKCKVTMMVAMLVILAFGQNLAAQTVTPVSAGDGTLNDAVVAAADGDTLELVDSGGLYTFSASDKIVIDKSLTIRAQAGLEQMPIVRNTKSDAGSARLFEIQAGGNLSLWGLDLDGRLEDNGAAHAKNIIRSVTGVVEADTFHFNVKVENCLLHDATEAIMKINAFTHSDTVIFRNSFLYEARNEGIVLRESSSRGGPKVQYVELTNTTFSRIGREAFYHEFSDPVIRINHCTFDSVAYRENKRIIYPNGVTDVEIKNSVFTDQGSANESVKLYGNSTISYSDTFNVGPVALNDNSSIGAGMLGVDPLYADRANKDFTIDENSPIFGMADEGFAMGDLRWDPSAQGPTVHKISAGDGTLNDAVVAAEDGDIIELIDSGGLYTHSAGDKIVIDKSLTIRAREGLAQMPIVRNTDLGTSSARLFEIQAGGNLSLWGLDLDGRAEDNGAAHAKNIIRSVTGVAEADTFHFNVRVENCLLHDVTEAIMKINAFTHSDTVIFKNSFLYEARNEGIVLRESSSRGGPKVKYVELTNTTFSRIGREAFYHEFSDPVIRINHCTFDSVAYRENKRIIYPNGVTDVEIKNSIFTDQGSTNESVRLFGNSTISYSDTFNVGSVALRDNASIGAGMLGVDPLYADRANRDFRLATNSPVRTMADDGLSMGDLRWEADPGQFFLTVITEGSGVVTRDLDGPFYDPGTQVSLTAVPDPNWEFDRWVGNVFPPTANPVTITMNGNETITAKFVDLRPKYTLSVDSLGLGGVTLNPEPVDGKYDEGTVVQLTAVPQPNWAFVEWLGDASGSDNPLSVTVNSDLQITASFASLLTQFALNVDTVGMGGVVAVPEPVLGSYDSSTVVLLTAETVPGWEFTGWSGDLVSVANPDSVVMDANKTVTATFAEIQVPNGRLEVTDAWDLRDAVEFANNNSTVDTLVLTTSGGLYTSTSPSDVAVRKALTIMAAPGLAEKPIITNSDVEAGNDDIFRVFDDFTIKGVILDGGHATSHGMKYGIRLRNYTDTMVKAGANINILDTDFRNFFENKSPQADGHALRFDVDIVAGTVLIENSSFTDFGYEAIRISDTEKYATDRALDSLIIRNSTFTNIDAEAVRYYSDTDVNTPDAPVILENLTINNSGTRVFYLKNSGGAVVRNIIIANSRQSGHGRDDDLMEAQGLGSTVSHIDTFNVKSVPIEAPKDGVVDTTTVYGFDPMFADAANGDYTLLPGSPLYTLAHDGGALGDRNWATNMPTSVEGEDLIPLEYSLSQNYPNPFNPVTTINFTLEEQGLTVIKIYNILGHEVSTLANRKMEAGRHTLTFDASQLSTGVYVYKITSGDFSAVKKMLLLK